MLHSLQYHYKIHTHNHTHTHTLMAKESKLLPQFSIGGNYNPLVKRIHPHTCALPHHLFYESKA